MRKKILAALLGIAFTLSSSILVFASVRPYTFILSCTTVDLWLDPNSDPDDLTLLYDVLERLYCGGDNHNYNFDPFFHE